MGKFTKWDILAVVIIASVPASINVIRLFVFDIAPKNVEGDSFFYFCIGTAYSFTVTSSLYFGCVSIFHYFNKRLPWHLYASKRLPLEVLAVFGYSTLAQFLIILTFTQTSFFDDVEVNTQFYFENILFGNTLTLIVLTLTEGVYFFRRWKESLLLTEKMKSENLTSQLNSLKTQLDPHFLFNSLNVLSSLIKKDTDKAELFVEDFSKVYRYVLEVKDEMVVSLSSELKFMEAYSNLQKIRFGEALQIRVNINPRPMTLFLPPLSLQELVSNAVKHNEVSLENPLIIEIMNRGDDLIVRNNLQRRDEELDSTGLGLDNIKKRYSLLSDKQPEFEIQELHFEATLPLLEMEN